MLSIFSYTGFYFSGNEYKIVPDTGYLKTDMNGNILGGDAGDWNFDPESFQYYLKYKDEFLRPFIPSEPHTTEMPASIYYKVRGNDATISWYTLSEKGIKEFTLQRAEVSSDNWINVGSLKARGNTDTDTETWYKIHDYDLPEGVYSYRLSFSVEKYSEYAIMPGRVFSPSPQNLQFYPVYPNPVTDTITVCFYIPRKQKVSMYFLNDTNKIYLLEPWEQESGVYKYSIDKKSLGFNNEIKRLYIECESCDKKKNFGDIQF